MADTKISGLPASTTPLTGTEVLPIVQSGVTKQVSVANLTAGRDIIVNGLTVGLGGGSIASNTIAGYQAGYSNTTGSFTAVGFQAGYSNSTGTNLIGIGYKALYSNTSGISSVAVGDYALFNNTANNSTAVGYQAGYSNTTGLGDFFGYQAGYANTTGVFNTLIGYRAGYNITTSNNNTCLGFNSGLTLSTGSGGNLYVGQNTTASSSSVTNEILISGYSGTGKGQNTGFITSPSGVYQGNNLTLWSVTSDQRIKKNIVDNNIGLEVINQIQVRNFEYRLPEEITEVPSNQAIEKTGLQLGVIAQELAQVLPECVTTQSTGVMTVNADNLTWYLINAVKELSAEVQSLKSQLGA
jgi:hypothetical protein